MPVFRCSPAPAPNAGAIRRNQPQLASELAETLRRRWANIFAVASDLGYQTLVMGAWGCGAFRNDPTLVAEAAREALAALGSESRVIFAIPNFNVYSQANLDAFRTVFSGE